MTIESRSGAKKAKSNSLHLSQTFYLFLIDRLMYWQLLDNEKHVQCSESSTTTTKENNTRDSSTTSLSRTMSRFLKTTVYYYELSTY